MSDDRVAWKKQGLYDTISLRDRIHMKGDAMEWKKPDFEEIETRAEVTAYAAHWE